MNSYILNAYRAAVLVLAAGMVIGGWQKASAQKNEVVYSAEEKPIAEAIRGIRSVPDDVRGATTKDLAARIRKLPASENRVKLAAGLAGRATEGDYGHDTLQEVANTLTQVLKEQPQPWEKAEREGGGGHAALLPAYPYVELASLVRYEHVETTLDNEQVRAAMEQLEADDRKRAHPEFELTDLAGKKWKFADLRGKVVLVNFWATWCPPCRKEMPDLEALYEKFGPQGFVVLGISDEETGKVEPFIREKKVSFPVLLDPGRRVNELFVVDGIPKSFVYDREGKLVAQSIDMRTRKQFLEMLAKAGLE